MWAYFRMSMSLTFSGSIAEWESKLCPEGIFESILLNAMSALERHGESLNNSLGSFDAFFRSLCEEPTFPPPTNCEQC